MNKIFSTALKVLTAVIFVVGIYFSFNVMSNGDPKNIDAEQLGVIEWNKQLDEHVASGGTVETFSPDKSPEVMGEEIATEIEKDIVSGVSTTINFTLIVLWSCVVISLLTFLYAVVTDFKRFMPFIIGTVILLIIIGIAYAMSSTTVPANLADKTDGDTYKLVSTGILTTFILIALAFGGWILGEVYKLFK